MGALHIDVSGKATLSVAHSWALGPFFKWVIDLIGLLLKRKGNAYNVIIAIDHFIKWVEDPCPSL